LGEGEVAVFIAAVEFIAGDGMAKVSEVDADLMFAASAGKNPQKRKWKMEGGRWRHLVNESLFDKEFGLGGRAVGTDAIFDGDNAALILAQGRINDAMVFTHMAVDDGEIFFLEKAVFKGFSEFTGGRGIFGNENNATGFAIEAVDQIGSGVWRVGSGFRGRGSRFPGPGVGGQIEPGAADEAGHLTVLGGMADKTGGFVDDEQVGVFKNDIEHSQCLMIGATKTRILSRKFPAIIGKD
jgi:hypothetical protein